MWPLMSSSSPKPKAASAFYGRTLDRLQALQLLFQAEATRRSVPAVLEDVYVVSDDVVASDEGRKENLVTTGPIRPYARKLVLGVKAHQGELDSEISGRSIAWDFSRITPVDKNVLRVALYEMIYEDEVDDSVCVSEAVLLAKALGGEDSHRFVNGILGSFARAQEGPEPTDALDRSEGKSADVDVRDEAEKGGK